MPFVRKRALQLAVFRGCLACQDRFRRLRRLELRLHAGLLRLPLDLLLKLLKSCFLPLIAFSSALQMPAFRLSGTCSSLCVSGPIRLDRVVSLYYSSD